MVNWKDKKLGDLLILGNGIALIILVNVISSFWIFRIDLTEEKRYSIKPQTKKILQNLEDHVYIEIFLEGDLNPGFKRFRKAIGETLDQFRVFSNNKVTYTFTDPAKALSQKGRSEFMADLAEKGIQPTNVIDARSGDRKETLIFPGAIVSYGGEEKGVMLLKGNKAGTPEEEINQSIEGIEFEFANAVYKLSNADEKKIGIVRGHGELDSLQGAGLYQGLSEVYVLTNTELSKTPLSDLHALVIAKPTGPFSVSDKFAIDQYIMQGGKVLFLLDRLEASMDSAASDGYFAFPYKTGLDDQLFKYGVRINPDLIQDRYAAFYPVVTGQSGTTPRIQLIEWPFFPLINHFAVHPVTRNLDAVLTRFVSSIDTVKATGVKKTPLMFTSAFTRKIAAPVSVNINQFRERKQESFNDGVFPVAYLLEGKFTSAFKNRFLDEQMIGKNIIEESIPTRMIVVSDGDIGRNDINRRNGMPQPLGYDSYTKYTYANQELLMNMVASLVEDNGIILARNREVTIRPLDRDRISAKKTQWQLFNLVIPVILIAAYGTARAFFRRRKYIAGK